MKKLKKEIDDYPMYDISENKSSEVDWETMIKVLKESKEGKWDFD